MASTQHLAKPAYPGFVILCGSVSQLPHFFSIHLLLSPSEIFNTSFRKASQPTLSLSLIANVHAQVPFFLLPTSFRFLLPQVLLCHDLCDFCAASPDNYCWTLCSFLKQLCLKMRLSFFLYPSLTVIHSGSSLCRLATANMKYISLLLRSLA